MKTKLVKESLNEFIDPKYWNSNSGDDEIRKFLGPDYDKFMNANWEFAFPEGYSTFNVVDMRTRSKDSRWSFYVDADIEAELILFKADKTEWQEGLGHKYNRSKPWIVMFTEYTDDHWGFKEFGDLISAASFMGNILGFSPEIKTMADVE